MRIFLDLATYVLIAVLLNACSSTNDLIKDESTQNKPLSQLVPNDETAELTNISIDSTNTDSLSIVGKWWVYELSDSIAGDGFLLNSIITFTATGEVIFNRNPEYYVTYEPYEGYFVSTDHAISLVKRNEILNISSDSLTVSTVIDEAEVVLYMRRLSGSGE